ncbi:hypothetical protein ALC56_10258 [Trachymyrmex septentrionalis]|uniref:Uncharacterized protein n=1 Tax=Trachymyrmex septentrionalis TaxID=34720 RepID=A0A195F4N2_9HYME|nr:hypothetical protein ALC56_10258 [Trachymyrmex septentrionalis]
MSTDCSSVEIGAERIGLGLDSPGIRTNISIYSGWVSLGRVYGDSILFKAQFISFTLIVRKYWEISIKLVII